MLTTNNFWPAMVEYRKSVNKAKREKHNKPLVTDYIGMLFKDNPSIIQT